MTMIGTQVGQFVIRRLLGEGGMGAVYLAEHAVLKTPRAVKVLQPRWTTSQVIVQRFVNEARAAASIRHRNIIEVFDVGQLPGGQWFILLDYIEGQTLAQYLHAQGGPIAPHRIVHIASEIANGLQAAHEHAIVHRDLKPDNIFLSARDGDQHRATILDFGVARLGAERAGLITHAGVAIGTPAYMAPEQLRGEPAGPAADIYALGAIVYQMTTGGRLPFQDDASPQAYHALSAAEVYQRQRARPPNDLRRYAPEVSEAWVRAIHGALDPDPGKRPATAGALARLLAEAAPSDGYTPSGIEIVRTYARELLDIGAGTETVRQTPRPRPAARSRYRLGPKLGTGGMAEVFLGTVVGAEGFARQVAIKRVLAGHSEAPKFAAMFIEEARIASQLSHPNVVAVLDFDRDPEGRLFLVMEFVDGKDLDALCEPGRLPPSVTTFIISEILRGLGYAHELPNAGGIRGFVHRDVSPHNVLVSWEGAVKVSDFGIAKALEGSGGARSGLVKGKPSYMSPEQVSGEALDGRSDLFAVGILLWELLAGAKLFTGGTREAFAKILFRHVPRPSEHASGVPADLEEVAMRLLARDREDRYPTAEAAIEALARCADNPRNGRSELARWLALRFPADRRARAQARGPAPGAVTCTAPLPQVTTLDIAASQATPHTTRRPRIVRSRPALYGGAAVATCALAAAITVAVATRDEPDEPAADAGPSERLAARAATSLSSRGPAAAARTGAPTGERAAAPSAPSPEPVIPPPATPVPASSPAPAAPPTPSAPAIDLARPAERGAAPADRARAPADRGPREPADRGPRAPADRGPAPPARATAVRRESPPLELGAHDAHGAHGAHGALGALVVRVQPWAEVWVDGASAGQTPVRMKLRAGPHRIRLKNDRKQKTVTVTVTSARETVIEETW